MVMTELVRALLMVLTAYGAAGLLFAVVFHRRGLARVDAGTPGCGPGFRVLITPGLIALWPLLARRWWQVTHGDSFRGGPDGPVSPRRLRAGHAFAWKVLAVLVPLAVGAALWWRPEAAPASRFKTPGLELKSAAGMKSRL